MGACLVHVLAFCWGSCRFQGPSDIAAAALLVYAARCDTALVLRGGAAAAAAKMAVTVAWAHYSLPLQLR